ncbi:MAG: NADH-quinone oxidoreductase subunit NuoG [Saezia sp.]
MAIIHIDGKSYEVNGADNLLQACLSLGMDVPYFCWHPELGSAGACRQCAVKVYKDADDKRGRIVMACMSSASDGTYISIDDEEAKAFRESVIEFLLLNHPHDCPVCEEGGNCHLQDMTVMVGHSSRKYRFNKATHNNQDLGPFVNHEMNRCIACYRCVRYYKDYAGGTDFGVFGAHDNVYFGRHEEGTLESEFSGNLVEICPTGVFTDKTHSFRYNRKWDMQYAPSICQQCSVGCNISPGERYGELRRIENRFHGAINHYFLCDRGRFGYGYVNLQDRPREPKLKQQDQWVTLDKQQTVQQLTDFVKNAKGVVGIGSPRASLESNFALRMMVGRGQYSVGVNQAELDQLQLMLQVMQESGAQLPSLREIEEYDAILVLGEDVTQTAPRVALSIRQALKGLGREQALSQQIEGWRAIAVKNITQRSKNPFFITGVDETRLDDVASICYRASAQEQTQLAFAIAHALDKSAPIGSIPLKKDVNKDAVEIAKVLKKAKKPLIVTGTNAGSGALIQAASNIVAALKKQGSQVGLVCVAPEVNSMGVALLGGESIESAFEKIKSGKADTLIVLENSLDRHMLSTEVNAVLAQVKNLVVIDHQDTDVMRKAHLQISSASFAEADGTVVNHEGRAQRFFQVFDPSYYDDVSGDDVDEALKDKKRTKKRSVMLESWRWLGEACKIEGKNAQLTLDEIIHALVKEFPQLGGIVEAAPDAGFRVEGMKQARQPSRYSGRTSMRADITVHEQGQPQDIDSSLSFSMEGYSGSKRARSLVPFAWAPGWNSPQAWNRFQDEVGAHLRAGDSGQCLIKQNADVHIGYFEPSSDVVEADAKGWQVAPYYSIFGSEELSQRSLVIQERMGAPTAVLGAADAKKLKLEDGDQIELSGDGFQLNLTLRVSQTLQTGQVGLPVGWPNVSPALISKRVESVRKVTK